MVGSMSGADGPTRRRALAGGLASFLIFDQAWADAGQGVVMTRFGPVRGVKEGGLQIFKGLRYGQDTRLTRFARPQPPVPWQDVVDADTYGSACPQPGREPNQSEDCLFLNIWTPGLDPRAKRPVMVYIHGGAYHTGSGTSPLTDGSLLASQEDVVVVTLNHRLNLFGYLYLAQLMPDTYPDSGNAGQWDLVLALNWIKANIARFGGDPQRVMVFGQSGGGAKIASLMAAPAAAGLFHAVATMSGQQVTASGPLNATRRASTLLDALKTSPQEVVNLPAQRLLEGLMAADPINPSQKLYMGPVLDQRHLTRHPFWPDAPAQSAHLPMILGNVADETRGLIGRSQPDAFDLTFEALPTWLAAHMRTDIAPAHVIATYQAAYPGISASDLFFKATTAARSWRGQVEEADARARQQAPTWVYRLDLKSPEDGGKWGAYHTIDIPHAFRTLAASGPMTGTGPDAQRVSQQLSSALVHLARTGSPATKHVPHWPRYDLPNRQTMILDATSRVERDPRGVERALFQTVPFIQWGS